MRKHKRYVTLASLMLCAALLLAAVMPARAANVVFTAINNDLLELSSDTLPTFSDGRVYVPGSVFASTALGVATAQSRQQIYLYKDGSSLTFSAADETTMDHNGKYYNIKPIYRYGRIYVPAEFVCIFFGFTYSYITSSKVAPIVRIKYGDALDDAQFADAATPTMRNRLNRYESSLVTPTPEITPAVTPTPSAAPNYGNVKVYLALTGLDGERTPEILNQLKRANALACFFLTAEDIESQPGLTRRIMGEGHAVGLLAVGDHPNREWRQAADALLLHTTSKTVLAACLTGDGSEADELGLRLCFDGEAPIYSEDGLGAEHMLKELRNAGDVALLILDTDGDTTASLRTVLDFIRIGRFDIRALRETSTLGSDSGVTS